jgi:hypothetical protein
MSTGVAGYLLYDGTARGSRGRDDGTVDEASLPSHLVPDLPRSLYQLRLAGAAAFSVDVGVVQYLDPNVGKKYKVPCV